MISDMLSIERAFRLGKSLTEHIPVHDALYNSYIQDMNNILDNCEVQRIYAISCLNSFHSGVSKELGIKSHTLLNDSKLYEYMLVQYLKCIHKYVRLFPNPTTFFKSITDGLEYAAKVETCSPFEYEGVPDLCEWLDPALHALFSHPITAEVHTFLKKRPWVGRSINIVLSAYLEAYGEGYITSGFDEILNSFLSISANNDFTTAEAEIRERYLNASEPYARAWAYAATSLHREEK